MSKKINQNVDVVVSDIVSDIPVIVNLPATSFDIKDIAIAISTRDQKIEMIKQVDKSPIVRFVTQLSDLEIDNHFNKLGLCLPISIADKKIVILLVNPLLVKFIDTLTELEINEEYLRVKASNVTSTSNKTTSSKSVSTKTSELRDRLFSVAEGLHKAQFIKVQQGKLNVALTIQNKIIAYVDFDGFGGCLLKVKNFWIESEYTSFNKANFSKAIINRNQVGSWILPLMLQVNISNENFDILISFLKLTN